MKCHASPRQARVAADCAVTAAYDLSARAAGARRHVAGHHLASYPPRAAQRPGSGLARRHLRARYGAAALQLRVAHHRSSAVISRGASVPPGPTRPHCRFRLTAVVSASATRHSPRTRRRCVPALARPAGRACFCGSAAVSAHADQPFASDEFRSSRRPPSGHLLRQGRAGAADGRSRLSLVAQVRAGVRRWRTSSARGGCGRP
jgi:hypothetical protein